MPLTTEQVTALRAACFANPTTAAFIAAGNPAALRQHLNSNGSKVVWRNQVSMSAIYESLADADWTQFDNLTAGQARIWENLRFVGFVNFSSSAVRAAITECWKGTAAKAAVATRLLTFGKRSATVAEGMLAVGEGTTAAPATLTFEGQIEEVESVLLVFRDDGSIWTP